MSLIINFHIVTVDPEWVGPFSEGVGVPYGEEEHGVKSKQVVVSARNLTQLYDIMVGTIFDNEEMYTYHQLTQDGYRLLLKALDVEILRIQHNGVEYPEHRNLTDLQTVRRELDDIKDLIDHNIIAVSWG